MQKRSHYSLLFAGFCLLAVGGSRARLAAQSVIAVSPRQCVWRPGNDPAWAARDLDERGWRPYPEWKLNPEEPRYWVRCHVDLSALSGMEHPAMQVNVGAAYRLYVNGIPIGEAGNLHTGNFGMNLIQSFPLPRSAIASEPVTLAIGTTYRVSHTGVDVTFPNLGSTTIPIDIRAGDSRLLAALRDSAVVRRVREPIIGLASYGVVGVLGLVLLGLFLFDRDHRELLLLGVSCASVVTLYLTFCCDAVLVDYPIWTAFAVFAAGASVVNVTRIWFFFALARRRVPLLFWILIGLSVLPYVVILPGLFLPAGGSLRLDDLNIEWIVPLGLCALIAASSAPFLAFWPYGRIARRMRPLAMASMVWGLTMALFFSSSSAFARLIGLPMLSRRLMATTGVSAFTEACVIAVLLGLLFVEQRKTALERAALAGEMQAASEIQHLLAPAEIDTAPGLKIDVAFCPMREVGGDFYLCRVLPDGRQRVLVGDVSGKGAAAAMAAALLLGAAEGRDSDSPGVLLAHLNRVLRRAGIGGFATCLCADVASNGVVTMANAGHLPPYCRGEEIAVESGLPLGIADGAYSGYEQSRILLGNDDTLTFLTDGVAEARDAQGGLFGFERTAAISARPAEEVARAALAFGQEDDITVLTVKRLGTAAGIETLASTLVETSLRAQFENETS